MAEQSVLAKLGLRVTTLGSSANLAFAFPLAEGSIDVACHTDAACTGFYGDRTGGSEKFGFVVGGQTGPTFTRNGSVVDVNVTGALSGVNSTWSGNVALTGAAATLTVGDNASTTPVIALNGAAGNNKQIQIKSGGLNRWILYANNVAESGGDVGSNLVLSAYDDSGAFIDNPLSIARVAAGTIAFTRISSWVTSASANMFLNISAPSGQSKYIQFQTSGSIRWQMTCTNGAESGSDVGSAWVLSAYTDSAVFIDNPITVTRASGGSMTLTRPITHSGNLFTMNNANPFLTVGGGTSTAATLSLNAAAATSRILRFQTAGSIRWQFIVNNNAESGSNAGSNLNISSYDDSGVFIDSPLSITRAAGGQITTTRGITLGVDDSATNASTTLLTLNHTSTGTVANSFGTNILFNLEDDGGTNRNAGRINVNWTTAATATRTSQMLFQLVNQAGAFGSALTLNPTTATFSLTGSFFVTTTDAVTNAVSAVAAFQHLTSGTAAAGYGTRVNWNGPDDGGTNRSLFLLDASWTDAASATRTSKIVFNIINSAVSVAAYSLTPVLSTQVSNDAATSSATVVTTFQHATSGTAAVGFGSIIQVQGHDDGATQRVMSQISTQWTDAASATRTSKLTFVGIVNAVSTNYLILSSSAATFLASDAATSSQTVVANFQHATSGTAAASFGSILQFQGHDDGATMRNMAQINVLWSTATSASRASKIIFNVVTAAVLTTALTLNPTSANFASGFPVTVADTTDGTSGTAGAFNTLGGIGVTKALWVGTNITAANGDMIISTVGKGLKVKEGSSGRSGNATLVAGTVTVTCTNISSTNSRIHLTRKTAGGTVGSLTYTISDGASFTINSDNALDTSTITYLITEAA